MGASINPDPLKTPRDVLAWLQKEFKFRKPVEGETLSSIHRRAGMEDVADRLEVELDRSDRGNTRRRDDSQCASRQRQKPPS
jgi:hypothetical protein